MSRPGSLREELPVIEARIRVRLTPRASRDEIAGWQGDLLRVKVTAPPLEGRANDALERLLAATLGAPKGAVRVVAGVHSREKLVAVDGIAQDEAMRRLGAATLL
jgi:uncharacterized protein (TIGR00251 family)